MARREYTVEKKGVGKPDYSSNIYAIKRGETFVLFEPRPDERQKIFYVSHPLSSPLAVGETVHLIDRETNLATPYTSPIGFVVSQRERFFSFNGAIRFTLAVDTLDPIVLFPSSDSLMASYEAIAAIDTKYWDPEAGYEHTWDMTITNIDTIPLSGMAQLALIFTEIGSSVMTKKKVRCLKCGNIMVVPLKQTMLKCTECGYAFVVPFFGKEII